MRYVTHYEEYPIYEPAEGGYYYSGNMEQKIGRYYILPSSIHELIFVPADAVLKSDLADMVREVNASVVSEDDYLANDVFEMSEWI